jgi:Flp pilus assembly protein TadD
MVREGAKSGPINQALGLTIYCWRRLAGTGGARTRSGIMIVRVASSRRVRLFTAVALAALLAGALAGCKTTGSTDTTGSIAPRSEAESRRDVESLGERFRANPRQADNAIRYAQALRANGQRAQAAAVLETAAIHNPEDKAVLGAYGRALADAGNFKQALDVLNRAHSPDQPDWRILSVQGAVLDQLGRHEEAQRYYASALKIAPDEPSVLSNLGLSYALGKDLKRAEETLRRASAKGSVDKRVRQNLALVVGLQGRFPEAESIARADLPPDEASANVTYLRSMLSQRNPLKPKSVRPRTIEGLEPVEEAGS